MSVKELSTRGGAPNGSPGAKGRGGSLYTKKSTGTNSQGNRYSARDYYSSQPTAPNKNTYHYSNKDGSYYYSNPDGSTYYNDGNGGAWYSKK